MYLIATLCRWCYNSTLVPLCQMRVAASSFIWIFIFLLLFRFFPVDHLLLRFRRFKKDSVTADPACTHEACAYITCKKICNQTFIDANPSSPVVAPAECSAYANDQGRNYEYRCFPSVPILPDEHWQGGHGPNSMGAHKPPTTSATPLIVSFLRCTCFLP